MCTILKLFELVRMFRKHMGKVDRHGQQNALFVTLVGHVKQFESIPQMPRTQDLVILVLTTDRQNQLLYPLPFVQVIEFCRSALSQCSLLQHPAVVPLPPPTSSLDASFSAAAQTSIHTSYYQVRDGSHSRSTTPLPSLRHVQFREQGTPMETLPSAQPSLTELHPNRQDKHLDTDRTKANSDLQREGKSPNTNTKTDVRSLESVASVVQGSSEDTGPTASKSGIDKNNLVAKDVTSSCSSDSQPSTSTIASSCLHQGAYLNRSSSDGRTHEGITGAQTSYSGSTTMLEGDFIPFRGSSDSDSDTGVEMFVDKPPDTPQQQKSESMDH